MLRRWLAIAAFVFLYALSPVLASAAVTQPQAVAVFEALPSTLPGPWGMTLTRGPVEAEPENVNVYYHAYAETDEVRQAHASFYWTQSYGFSVYLESDAETLGSWYGEAVFPLSSDSFQGLGAYFQSYGDAPYGPTVTLDWGGFSSTIPEPSGVGLAVVPFSAMLLRRRASGAGC